MTKPIIERIGKMEKEDKHKKKSCWMYRDIGMIHTIAEKECKNCTSKKCKRRLRELSRRNIYREAIIEQVTKQLWSTTPKEIFDVSNIILNTNFSVEQHRLVSRL